MLVDDDETANFISKKVMQSAGIEEVDELLSGKQACDYLENDYPDCIFLDIRMPVMDGWEVLDEIKARGLCKDIKVVMLTSSTHLDDKEKAQHYNCIIAYMEKPLTMEKVEEIKEKMAAIKEETTG